MLHLQCNHLKKNAPHAIKVTTLSLHTSNHPYRHYSQVWSFNSYRLVKITQPAFLCLWEAELSVCCSDYTEKQTENKWWLEMCERKLRVSPVKTRRVHCMQQPCSVSFGLNILFFKFTLIPLFSILENSLLQVFHSLPQSDHSWDSQWQFWHLGWHFWLLTLQRHPPLVSPGPLERTRIKVIKPFSYHHVLSPCFGCIPSLGS